MSTPIPQVDSTAINHAIFMDLTLDGNVYYISNAYAPIGIDGNVYTELGAYLTVSSMQDDIRTTNGDIQINLMLLNGKGVFFNIVGKLFTKIGKFMKIIIIIVLRYFFLLNFMGRITNKM